MSVHRPIDAVWGRIDRWLVKYAPVIAMDLNSGASAQTIQDAETLLGVSLPEDFSMSLRIHNGQNGHARFQHGLTLLSLDQIVSSWQQWKELYDAGEWEGWGRPQDDPIQPEYWHPKWIPFLADLECYDALDMAPLAGGKVGQIIRYVTDDNERGIVMPDYFTWLDTLARDLEGDKYELYAGGLFLR